MRARRTGDCPTELDKFPEVVDPCRICDGRVRDENAILSFGLEIVIRVCRAIAVCVDAISNLCGCQCENYCQSPEQLLPQKKAVNF